MDLLSSTSIAIEIVANTVKCIEWYCGYQRTCNNPDQHLEASSLLVICKSIYLALRQIQEALRRHEPIVASQLSDDGDTSQSLNSVLASCQVTFKILLDKVQPAVPVTQEGASSSFGKARDLWPVSDIESLAQNVSRITSGLQLLVHVLNLYVSSSVCGSISNH
jgi:hypothetical protein